jgi:hypothetical protein
MTTNSIITIGKLLALLTALSFSESASGQAGGATDREEPRTIIDREGDRKGGAPVPLITAACYSPKIGEYRPAELTIMTTDGAICGYYNGSVYLYHRTRGSNGPWRGGIAPSSACVNRSTGAYTGMLTFQIALDDNQEIMVTTSRAEESLPESSSNLLPVKICSMTAPRPFQGRLIALPPAVGYGTSGFASVGDALPPTANGPTLRWVDTSARALQGAYRVSVRRVEKGATPEEAFRNGRVILERRVVDVDELGWPADLAFDSSTVHVWSVRSIDPSGTVADDSIDAWATPVIFPTPDLVESTASANGMAITVACLAGRLVRVSGNAAAIRHGRSMFFRRPGGEWSGPAALLPTGSGGELMFQLPLSALAWPSIEIGLAGRYSGAGGATSNIVSIGPCPVQAPRGLDRRMNVPLAETGRRSRSGR